MTKEEILSKIKKLQALAESQNDNEAANARKFAEKLIEKYQITEEDLNSIKDKGPLYGENEKLFHSSIVIPWKNQLALGIANHFGCYIVQEELVPADGSHEYDYYVYGEDEDVESVKFAFNAFEKQIDSLVLTNCPGRGPVYVSSYCEGVVQSIRSNIEIDGIEIPKVNSKLSKPDKMVVTSGVGVGLVTIPKDKEKPVEKSVSVNGSNAIRDIMAFLKGLQDGRDISLQDAVELEFQSVRNLIGE